MDQRSSRSDRHRFFWFLVVTGIGLVAAAWVVLPGVLERELPGLAERHYGLELQVEELELDLSRLGLILRDVRASGALGGGRFSGAGVQFDLAGLLRGRAVISGLSLWDGELTLPAGANSLNDVGGLLARLVPTRSLELSGIVIQAPHGGLDGVELVELSAIIGGPRDPAELSVEARKQGAAMDLKGLVWLYPRVPELEAEVAISGASWIEGWLGAGVELESRGLAAEGRMTLRAFPRGAAGWKLEWEGGGSGETLAVKAAGGSLNLSGASWTGRLRVDFMESEERRVTFHGRGDAAVVTLSDPPGGSDAEPGGWTFGQVGWDGVAGARYREGAWVPEDVDGDATVARVDGSGRRGGTLALERLAAWGLSVARDGKIEAGRARIGRMDLSVPVAPGQIMLTAGAGPVEIDRPRLGRGAIGLATAQMSGLNISAGEHVDDGAPPAGARAPAVDGEFRIHSSLRTEALRLDDVLMDREGGSANYLHAEGLRHSMGVPGGSSLTIQELALIDLTSKGSSTLDVQRARVHGARARLRRLDTARGAQWQLPVLPLPWSRIGLSLGLISGDNRVILEDRMLVPAASLSLDALQGRVSGLLLDGGYQAGRVDMSGVVMGGGPFSLEAMAHPDDPTGRTSLRIQADAVPSVAINSYLTEAVGLSTTDGRIAVDGLLTMTEGGIEGRLAIHGLGLRLESGLAETPLARLLRAQTRPDDSTQFDLLLHNGMASAAIDEALRQALVAKVLAYYGPVGMGPDAATALGREGRAKLFDAMVSESSGVLEPESRAALDRLADRLARRPLPGVELCPSDGAGDVVRRYLEHEGLDDARMRSCGAPAAASVGGTPAVAVWLAI